MHTFNYCILYNTVINTVYFSLLQVKYKPFEGATNESSFLDLLAWLRKLQVSGRDGLVWIQLFSAFSFLHFLIAYPRAVSILSVKLCHNIRFKEVLT